MQPLVQTSPSCVPVPEAALALTHTLSGLCSSRQFPEHPALGKLLMLGFMFSHHVTPTFLLLKALRGLLLSQPYKYILVSL